MATTAPPRPPDSTDSIDRSELEALVEALIEEARRRARRRRRRYAACFLLAALAAGGVYFGFHDGGGTIGTRSARAGSSGGAASAGALSAGSWAPSRGPYGGPAYVVEVAPSNPATIYLGTARGVFRSRNGGQSWQSAGLAVRNVRLGVLDLRITSLAVDPHAPGTVYATRSGWFGGGMTLRQELFKSTDGGRSWRALRLPATRVVVSPSDPSTIFAWVPEKGEPHHLLRSRDGGASWQAADKGTGATGFTGLAFDPATPAKVYAATERGVITSTDGGASWRPGRGVARQGASVVAVDPQHPQVVYAGTNSGVIGSLDGAQSWRMLNSVLGGHGRDRGYGELSSLAVDPHDSRTIYASVGCLGIFKSSDGGRRWHPVNALHGFSCLDTSLALDPRTRTIYAVYPGREGVFKSSNGGVRWHAANAGLNLTTVTSLALDSQHPQVVYAGARSEGLFKSSDRGLHWLPVGGRVTSVDAVAIDPHNPSVVLAAGAIHNVIRSSDAGRSWQSARTGMKARVAALAISGRYAYAGSFARGVFYSSDGGRSWQSTPGPGNNYVQALAIDPNDPTVVYAGSWGSDARGLYKSTDAGHTWRRLTDGLEDSDVSAVALDPIRPTTIYIGTGGGVFKSADGGATWQHASAGLARIRTQGITAAGNAASFTMTVSVSAIAVDPLKTTVIYAATHERGVFRSTDGGASWRAFNTGLAASDIASLAVDTRGRTLYAGTVSGGVVARMLAR